MGRLHITWYITTDRGGKEVDVQKQSEKKKVWTLRNQHENRDIPWSRMHQAFYEMICKTNVS